MNHLRAGILVRCAGSLVTILVTAGSAAGQGSVSPENMGRIRMGPLGLSPTISIVNAGVDNNVFNDAVNPKDDITATFNPSVQAWLKLGSTRLRGASTLSAVYFREFDSQRSFNRINEIRWEVPLRRVEAFAYYNGAHMNSFPNDEINTRVKNSNTTAGGGTTIRLGYRTSLVVEAQRLRTKFGDTEEFLGTNLSESLDRTSDNLSTSFRMDVTPLTTIVVEADVERDRFDHSPSRDAVMKGVSPGIEFGRAALITGTAYFGYRRFDMRSPFVPDYSGLTAALDLSYVLKERTRFSTRYDRDLVYSFSEIRPYYVEGRITASVAQQLTTSWELSFAASYHRQDYDVSSRGPGDPFPTLAPELTKLNSYRAGVIRRFGQKVRVGVNTDYTNRASGILGSYRATRVFSTVSYEF